MSRSVLLLSIVTAFLELTVTQLVRYDNYNLYTVTPKTINDLDFLHRLEIASDSIKFFSEIHKMNEAVSVLVAPHKEPEFTAVLKAQRVPYELVYKNFQKILDEERATTMGRRVDIYDWTNYHTLAENYDWLRILENEFPDNVEVIVGGSTFEGREILGVKVSFKPGNKGVFLEGGIHAREWISPATVTYILDQILRSNDTTVRKTVEKFDWYVFPHFNPDGYEYTHKKDRLWRKTRSPHFICYGVDPNRNWDFRWKSVGASSFPCSESYAGSSAFSEIETESLSLFINSLSGKIHTYIAFHSYSQLLLFPYGHTAEHAANHKDLQQIGDAAAKALARRYGTKYKVGNIYEAIYPAAGSSQDWVYGDAGVNISYTYELRPGSGSRYGFVLPANQIIPTGEETFDSLIALLREAEKLNYYT